MTDPPVDLIQLRGLRLLAICGVLPEERDRRQPFEVDLDVELDLAPAGDTDDLAATLDYGALSEAVVALADAERFQLLERMATRIAEVVLSAGRADAVTVTVRKLRPPVPVDVVSSGVRIRRTR
jgi:FolB domain-containing protein